MVEFRVRRSPINRGRRIGGTPALSGPDRRAGDDERRADAQGTAHRGQRLLYATGILQATQKLLGHASIQTTGDVYADWISTRHDAACSGGRVNRSRLPNGEVLQIAI
jgi:integrase